MIIAFSGVKRQTSFITGASEESRTLDRRFTKPQVTLKSLNKLTVSELAELSEFSKSYISQVKNGKRPPSQKLLDCLESYYNPSPHISNYYNLFIQSRLAKEITPTTMRFYKMKLGRFLNDIDPDKAKQPIIEKFLLQFVNPGNRHLYYQVIKTFFRWREEYFNLSNPTKYLKAPRLGKLIMPSLTQEQVNILIDKVDNIRDKAIITLFTESGLRLAELTNIKPIDIDWQNKTIKVLGKGNKEALAPFGELSARYLTQWLTEYHPNGNIWGLNQWGIVSMLRRLEKVTGLPCNAHTFRRTFACLLRKAGVDTMTIKDLGRWESLEMVQRYTRSVNFQDSLKFYKPPLS